VVVEQLQRTTSSHRSVSFVFPLYTVCGCGGQFGDAAEPYETCSFCFPLVLYTLEAVVVVEMMCLAALSPLFFFCYICLGDGRGPGKRRLREKTCQSVIDVPNCWTLRSSIRTAATTPESPRCTLQRLQFPLLQSFSLRQKHIMSHSPMIATSKPPSLGWSSLGAMLCCPCSCLTPHSGHYMLGYQELHLFSPLQELEDRRFLCSVSR